jgi:hypothetical protein
MGLVYQIIDKMAEKLTFEGQIFPLVDEKTQKSWKMEETTDI